MYKVVLAFIFILGFSLSFCFAQDDDVRRKGGLKLKNLGRTDLPAEQPNLQAAIYGSVIDKETAEPIPDVAIAIVNTQKGILSDFEGNFRLDNLPPGNYSLSISSLGYTNVLIDNILLKPGETLKVPIVLVSEDTELETVVVNSSAGEQSDLALLILQKSTTVVMDGFSGEMILEQTPGFQLSLALRRMPGVAMIDNRLLSIRGMYERYTNVMVNDAIMPFSDFERSGFDYSIIPANLVSSIVVIKSARSDLPSEFAGGLIQLRTSDIPNEDGLDVSLQFQYSDLATFKQFQGYPQEQSGWQPFPIETDPSKALPSAYELGRLSLGSDQRYEATKNYKPKFQPADYTAPLGTNAVVTYRKRFLFMGKQAGITAAVSMLDHYNKEFQTTYILDQYSESVGRNLIGDSSSAVMSLRTQNQTAMLNGGIYLKKGKITFNNIFLSNQSGFFYPTFGNVYDVEAGEIAQQYYFPTMRQTQSRMFSHQIRGKHSLERANKNNLTLDWEAGLSHLTVFEPGYRAITYVPGDSVDWVLTPTAYRDDSLSPYVLSAYDAAFSSRSRIVTPSGRITLTYPFTKNIIVKGGLFTNHRYRKFRSRLLGPAFPTEADEEAVTDLTEVQRDRNIGDAVFNPQNYRPGGLEMYELTTGVYNYNAQRQTWAAYVMPQWLILPRFNLQAGLRLETFHQSIDTISVQNNEEGALLNSTLTDLLPAANFIYYYDEKTNFRFSYGQTLVRPNERELVPIPFLDFVIGSLTFGNPDIQRIKVHNIDLKWERFSKSSQLFSVNFFYKYFDNPIEQVFVSGEQLDFATAVQNYQVLNQKRGQSAGIELEARWTPSTVFDYIWLKPFSTFANLTIQQSRINISNPFELLEDGRPLQGQAPYVINLGIIYETPDTHWSFGMFYNRTGQRIAFVGAGDTVFPSIWELPRDVVDFQIGKQWGKFGARLIINDFLNQPFRMVQIYEGRNNYKPGRDQVSKIVRRDFRTFLTLSYKL